MSEQYQRKPGEITMRNEHDKSKMHKATVVAPVVRLVTPTLRNTKSIAAFEDELLNYFGWQNVADFDYDVYSARNNNGRLNAQAKNAFDDAPTVIVTCGSQATLFAMGFTTTIPIIQAAGGQLRVHRTSRGLRSTQKVLR
jgi:ABC-type uncharacterized transport system substrate-binding protein